MGTNYYLHMDVCPHCGRSKEHFHIGKSSWGWCFALHMEPELGAHTLEDWKKAFKSGQIRDEYGNDLAEEEMLEIITERSRLRTTKKSKEENLKVFGYKNVKDFMKRNNAVHGPDGLYRHKIDGRYCISHGTGTWDYIEGNFS